MKKFLFITHNNHPTKEMIIDAYTKAKKVIKSCQTPAQLKAAVKYCNLFLKFLYRYKSSHCKSQEIINMELVCNHIDILLQTQKKNILFKRNCGLY